MIETKTVYSIYLCPKCKAYTFNNLSQSCTCMVIPSRSYRKLEIPEVLYIQLQDVSIVEGRKLIRENRALNNMLLSKRAI